MDAEHRHPDPHVRIMLEQVRIFVAQHIIFGYRPFRGHRHALRVGKHTFHERNALVGDDPVMLPEIDQAAFLQRVETTSLP